MNEKKPLALVGERLMVHVLTHAKRAKKTLLTAGLEITSIWSLCIPRVCVLWDQIS